MEEAEAEKRPTRKPVNATAAATENHAPPTHNWQHSAAVGREAARARARAGESSKQQQQQPQQQGGPLCHTRDIPPPLSLFAARLSLRRVNPSGGEDAATGDPPFPTGGSRSLSTEGPPACPSARPPAPNQDGGGAARPEPRWRRRPLSPLVGRDRSPTNGGSLARQISQSNGVLLRWSARPPISEPPVSGRTDGMDEGSRLRSGAAAAPSGNDDGSDHHSRHSGGSDTKEAGVTLKKEIGLVSACGIIVES
ncbi:uncharacterized protein LOC144601299 [Rhinoraja longicauda]